MEPQFARLDTIFNNGRSADVTVLQTGCKVPNVRLMFPSYHYARGEGMYSSVEVRSMGILWYTADNEPFIMGFGTGLQEGEFGEIDGYTMKAERMTPGSHCMKTRYGNKIVVERGGTILSYVNHICQMLLTPIKGYYRWICENLMWFFNAGRAHVHTYYDKETCNIDITVKDKRNPKESDKLLVSVGDDGDMIDIRYMKHKSPKLKGNPGMKDDDYPEEKGSVFQCHIKRANGNLYIYSPLTTLDTDLVVTGETRLKKNLQVEKNLEVGDEVGPGDVHIHGELLVEKRIVTNTQINSPSYLGPSCGGCAPGIQRAGAPSPVEVDLPNLPDKDIPSGEFHPDKEDEDSYVALNSEG